MATVLQVAGLAMFARALPVVRQGPAWVVLALLLVALLVPSIGLGHIGGLGAPAGTPLLGSWMVVAGLWIASVPLARHARGQLNAR
jgi:hypothetical protein